MGVAVASPTWELCAQTMIFKSWPSTTHQASLLPQLRSLPNPPTTLGIPPWGFGSLESKVLPQGGKAPCPTFSSSPKSSRECARNRRIVVIMCWSRAFLAHRFLRFLRDGKCFRMHGHSVQTGTGPWLFSASHIRILRAARNKGAQSERESQRQRKTDRQTGRQAERDRGRAMYTYV